MQPIWMVGARALWKNAQKKEKKKKASERINSPIPHIRLSCTLEVWHPMKVASRITSRHHTTIVRSTRPSPSARQKNPRLWNHAIRPVTRPKAPMAPVSGHGLGSTMCHGERYMCGRGKVTSVGRFTVFCLISATLLALFKG